MSTSRGRRGGSSCLCRPASARGDVVAELRGVVAERGGFRLGPIDLELGWGDRLAVVGRNGTGKTTLLRALLADLPLARGSRRSGARCASGSSTRGERRSSATGCCSTYSSRPRASTRPTARTLLAKFALGSRRRRPAGRDALPRRANARGAGAAVRTRRELPRARRADEPSRPGGDRGARDGARALRGNACRREPRPQVPRAAPDHAHACARGARVTERKEPPDAGPRRRTLGRWRSAASAPRFSLPPSSRSPSSRCRRRRRRMPSSAHPSRSPTSRSSSRSSSSRSRRTR